MSAIQIAASKIASAVPDLAADCLTNREATITGILNELFDELTAEIETARLRAAMKNSVVGDDLLMSAMHALTFSPGSSAERSAFVHELNRRMKINEKYSFDTL